MRLLEIYKLSQQINMPIFNETESLKDQLKTSNSIIFNILKM